MFLFFGTSLIKTKIKTDLNGQQVKSMNKYSPIRPNEMQMEGLLKLSKVVVG